MTTEYIETRMIPLAQLQPFPGNARRGNREKLVESLEANGQYRSLVVRRTDDGEHIVLAGNNTLAALEYRGDATARCEIVSCDDATALRVNLVDNKANDDATYDDEARSRLLELLDGEITGTGYTEDEVDSIIARYEEPELTAYAEPKVAEYNDDAEQRAERMNSSPQAPGTFESRGVRDIFLALPAAEADELGRLIMELRKTWGALPQGEVLLKAARVAEAVAGAVGRGLEDDASYLMAADVAYAPETDDEQADG